MEEEWRHRRNGGRGGMSNKRGMNNRGGMGAEEKWKQRKNESRGGMCNGGGVAVGERTEAEEE